MPQSTYIIDPDGGVVDFDTITVHTTPGTPGSNYVSAEDTSFVTGDSPQVVDANTALARNGQEGFVINDGPGDILIDISEDGAVYGQVVRLKSGEVMDLAGANVNKLRFTWVSDSAYRVFVK